MLSGDKAIVYSSLGITESLWEGRVSDSISTEMVEHVSDTELVVQKIAKTTKGEKSQGS